MSDMLRGVLPVFQVPYHHDETIDQDTLHREIDWLFECGVNGVTMEQHRKCCGSLARNAAKSRSGFVNGHDIADL
jgi:hypothetical protein